MSRVSYYNNLYNALSRMYGSGSGTGSVKSNKNTGNLAGLQDIASEYNSVRSGSYKKLVKSYYKNNAGKEDSQAGTIFDEMNRLRTVSGNASSLKGALSSLKRADFTGDKEGSLQKVKEFVDNYNSVIDNSVKVDRKGVLRDTLSMVNTTKHSSGLLSEVGITVGTDNKLTLDEDKWNNAHASTKKTLFGSSGYGSQVMYKASQVASGAAAGTGLSTKAIGYTNTGSTIKQPTTQSFLDMLF